MPRRSGLLGPDGQPIDDDTLFGPPMAGPTLTGVRSPISGHPADGLTPSRLAAIHHAAASGDPLGYWELAEDIEERDLHYAAVLGSRRRQVAQLSVHVEAASDNAEHVRHADLVRDWLKRGVLDAALFDMLDAIGKGYSILEIEWESTPERVAPRALTWRPMRWFELDRTDRETPLLIDGGGRRVPLASHKFIIHKHPSKSGLTVRSGLARVASWAWMYKAFTVRDWAIFAQNYGMPVRIGRYHPNATDADKEILWRAVANIAGDCAAIIPQGMEIELIALESAKSGAAGQLYSERADWMDRQISKLVLGQTATTDAIAGGHAVGKEHRLVQEDLERADAKLISATLSRQLVPLIISFNFGPQAKYPRIVVGRPDETPIETVIAALEKLGPLGLTVEASAVRDRLGFDDPAPHAELVGGRPLPRRNSAPADGEHAADLQRVEQHTVSFGPLIPLPEVARPAARDAADEVRAVFDQATSLHGLADSLTEPLESLDVLEAYRDAVQLTVAQYGLLRGLDYGSLAALAPSMHAAMAERRLLKLEEIEAVASISDDQRYAWLFGSGAPVSSFEVPREERAALVRAAIARGTPITEEERQHTLRHIRENPDLVY